MNYSLGLNIKTLSWKWTFKIALSNIYVFNFISEVKLLQKYISETQAFKLFLCVFKGLYKMGQMEHDENNSEESLCSPWI